MASLELSTGASEQQLWASVMGVDGESEFTTQADSIVRLGRWVNRRMAAVVGVEDESGSRPAGG